ncbi:ephrin type-A receptor 3-like [Physella acuta]|uniref:ephrin type-A receptor 3-like n=1 Tax=Physella acuta TaxID=109671 RepID=UPI0027DAF9B6|nr:ephrin type-A receptor 3-like [Physella acuta]
MEGYMFLFTSVCLLYTCCVTLADDVGFLSSTTGKTTRPSGSIKNKDEHASDDGSNENLSLESSVNLANNTGSTTLQVPFFDAATCLIKVGSKDDDVINLKPISRFDGFARYFASLNVLSGNYAHPLNYVYNPCATVNYPPNPPLGTVFGDPCLNILFMGRRGVVDDVGFVEWILIVADVGLIEWMFVVDDVGLVERMFVIVDVWWLFVKGGAGYRLKCQRCHGDNQLLMKISVVAMVTTNLYPRQICSYHTINDKTFYSINGINASDSISVLRDNSSNYVLSYKGLKSLRFRTTNVTLFCDHNRKGEEDGLFLVRSHTQTGTIAELYHECCCVGGCWLQSMEKVTDKGQKKKVGADGEKMLVIVGTLVSLIMMVALIGGLCYVKRTHLRIYSKLPGVTPQGISMPVTNRRAATMPPTLLGNPNGGTKNSDFRDYEPAAISSARKKMIPVLEDSNIQLSAVEMRQRLGGGIFGDTHLGTFNEMTVTVKRLTLSIHDNQLTSETMEWMKEIVWFLSRQRHKNIVCVLGLCLNGRLPFLLTEYVIGECLKDFLKANGQQLTWPQRIRLCLQVADGMAFLHSTKPPIIHRDLRCGNLFLSDNDSVKVADFGLIRLLQPMREQCNNDDCSCQRQLSACPATVRWTAPELLMYPRSREGESNIISTACDVYSFGLVMWEMVYCKDPFDEIGTEAEVIEIVRNSGRPDTPPSVDIMPQFKELMKTCWDQRPANRPAFKRVAVSLKDLSSHARSYQKLVSTLKMRLQKQHPIDHV